MKINKYPYVFLHLCEKEMHEQTISILKQAQDIHLYMDNNNNDLAPDSLDLMKLFAEVENNTNIYVYCFTRKDVEQTLAHGYTPHICVRGNDIFDDKEKILTYLQPEYEFFWFPQLENVLFQEPAHIANWLKKLNKPICISLSEIFNPDVAIERARMWLQTTQQLFPNPILEKEQNMLEDTFCEDNLYILQKNNEVITKKIVLGLYGDVTISSLEEFKKFNSLTIMKTKSCVSCEYQDNCMDRGLGYILYKYKYQQCIGIKLLKNETRKPL